MIEHFPINPALLLSTTKSRVNCLRGWLRRLPLSLDFRLRTFLLPSATLAGSLLSPVLYFVGRSIYSASSRAVYNRPTEPLSTQPRRAKAASMVKPMMRKRGWKVKTLAEFLPDEPQLLGLNINRTERILIRLRYHHDSRQFLSMEQITDTLLHELSHIVFGPHDAAFNNLWNELRDEHQSLLFKGYTGEGFLSQGQKLLAEHDLYSVASTCARSLLMRRRVGIASRMDVQVGVQMQEDWSTSKSKTASAPQQNKTMLMIGPLLKRCRISCTMRRCRGWVHLRAMAD